MTALWFTNDIIYRFVNLYLYRLKIDRRTLSARRASQNRRRILTRTGSSVYKWRRKLGALTVDRRLSFRSPLSSM